MCVLDGLTNLPEQRETVWHRKFLRIAIFVNRLPLNVFHHKVKQAIVRCTPIKNRHNIFVLQPREDFSFIEKPVDEVIGAQPPLDEFDRHLLSELILTYCLIHDAHAALVKLTDDLVMTNNAVELRVNGGAESRLRPGFKLLGVHE